MKAVPIYKNNQCRSDKQRGRNLLLFVEFRLKRFGEMDNALIKTRPAERDYDFEALLLNLVSLQLCLLNKVHYCFQFLI